MMPWWVLAVFVLGANFALWGSVGLIRLGESARPPARRPAGGRQRPPPAWPAPACTGPPPPLDGEP